MEIVQVEVSSDLVQRLRRYQSELLRILERGPHCIERQTQMRSSALPTREGALAALRPTGMLVELDPALAARYQAGSDQLPATPVRVEGKPLSEMSIGERDRQGPTVSARAFYLDSSALVIGVSTGLSSPLICPHSPW